jgi:hypothetical protein
MPVPRLRGCCALGYDAHVVIGNLEEPTFHMEPMRYGVAQAQLAVTEHGHHGSVTGEDTDLAVECRRDDRVRLALEQHTLGRDH